MLHATAHFREAAHTTDAQGMCNTHQHQHQHSQSLTRTDTHTHTHTLIMHTMYCIYFFDSLQPQLWMPPSALNHPLTSNFMRLRDSAVSSAHRLSPLLVLALAPSSARDTSRFEQSLSPLPLKAASFTSYTAPRTVGGTRERTQTNLHHRFTSRTAWQSRR